MEETKGHWALHQLVWKGWPSLPFHQLYFSTLQGELTMKQPIFHSDLATGIMNSLHDPEAVGQTYEAMGPQRLTQVEYH